VLVHLRTDSGHRSIMHSMTSTSGEPVHVEDPVYREGASPDRPVGEDIVAYP
jgi:hypothetical protein